ncbi:ABC transporter ATP-binding protein [Succinispira mobilis]|uniref:ABC transporter ATP-binding protein n=1 Tax=Succinispira mobilis TaxID=78120 RepID=UPI000363C464|nr:ABC transporter ATP-binding protein [Succinispira mobilis]
MNLYLRLLYYVKPYLPRLIIAGLCTILAAAGNLYVPWIIKDVIDRVLAEKDAMMLNTISLGIIVVFFLRGIFFYGQTYLMAYAGQRVIIDIRLAVYRQLQRLSLSFYEKRKTGTIMSYVTNDVGALQGALIDNVIELLTEGFVLLGSIIAMIYLDWKLTLFTFSTFPLVLIVIDYFGKKIRSSGSLIQERTADITSILQESISSARIIKSFVREDYEIKRFDRENVLNFKASIKNSQQMAALTPTIEFVAALGVTAIIWYGGREVISGVLTPGSLIAFLVYAVNISNPIKRLSRVYGNIQRALAAAQRVFDILDLQPEIQEIADAKPLPYIKGDVRFENVSFSYNPNEPVLTELSFANKAGQMVAIVGPSGAGKSTIANLLPRFYDITAGKIFIDDLDIKLVTLDSLREQIGIVPQETMLFNGSVYDNIRYGNLQATREEIEQAARDANAEKFILQLPAGYETMLGDRGVNLSGGQRQRIAIARAILKNPRILILDEATSALDTESEHVVQEALDRLMVGRTSFVIAHRLTTIQRADMILVLDKGKLVETGTHEQLLDKGGLYARLHQVQFAEKHA